MTGQLLRSRSIACAASIGHEARHTASTLRACAQPYCKLRYSYCMPMLASSASPVSPGLETHRTGRPLVDPPSRRNATCAIRQHTSSVCQDMHPRTAPPQTHACTHPEADSLPVELDPAAGGELLLVGCWLLLALRPAQLRSQGLTQAPVQLAWVMTCVVCALMFLPPFPLYRRGGWRRQRGACR